MFDRVEDFEEPKRVISEAVDESEELLFQLAEGGFFPDNFFHIFKFLLKRLGVIKFNFELLVNF